ncbi:hypothetical protein HY570_03930 [Candidatus Micrarchaeota archaeon]|nr:hypothetical protein [Candidatus Micrarchaeota archaeon]
MVLLDDIISQGEPYLAATTAIVIMIMLSGISIGIGKALQNKKLTIWGKEELLQAIINSALIGGLFLLITTLNTALTGLVPENNFTCLFYNKNTIIGFSQCYLYNLSLNVSELASILFSANAIISFLSSLSFNFIITFNPFNALIPIINVISKILELLYFLLFSIYIQINLLYAIDALMLSTFLPLGLILRCFLQLENSVRC